MSTVSFKIKSVVTVVPINSVVTAALHALVTLKQNVLCIFCVPNLHHQQPSSHCVPTEAATTLARATAAIGAPSTTDQTPMFPSTCSGNSGNPRPRLIVPPVTDHPHQNQAAAPQLLAPPTPVPRPLQQQALPTLVPRPLQAPPTLVG